MYGETGMMSQEVVVAYFKSLSQYGLLRMSYQCSIY